ncbi:TMhelix containing protein [Vibrio phage 1.208.B._10N.222.52.A7]|nr:TMhelix containing protein [Vibrio phage 1.208.B._10N.222.52.A7]
MMIAIGIFLLVAALTMVIGAVIFKLDGDDEVSLKLAQVVLICLCSGVSLLVISS